MATTSRNHAAQDSDEDDMMVDASSSGSTHKAVRLRVLSSDEDTPQPPQKKSRSEVVPNSIEITPIRKGGRIVGERFKFLESDAEFEERINEKRKAATQEALRRRNALLEHTKQKLKEHPTKGIQDHSKRRLWLFKNVEAILHKYRQSDDTVPDKMRFFTPEDLEKLENIHSCLDEVPEDQDLLIDDEDVDMDDEDTLMDVDTIHDTAETAFLLLQSDEPMLNNELDGLTEDDDHDLLQLPPLDSPASPPPSNGPSLVDLPEGMVQRSP
ncbi:hypothetical protein F5051DRAFT_447496, partial [Lentinula edodes]